ncbi:unnamed protein product [Thelazia callipaeda]|uniref:ATPase inhibitor, mitochondrial n=1 Tax=Thelazia callipaeda TaxID=103827 RepID=A0A0N5D1C9_THECL|nr:unnamed protein product [Thelazia callipaeda]
MYTGVKDPGSGVGKSGGGGGSIREAGGAFGKMAAAREEEYFYKLEKQQIKAMRSELEHKLQSKKDANLPMSEEEELTLKHLKKLAEIDESRGF